MQKRRSVLASVKMGAVLLLLVVWVLGSGGARAAGIPVDGAPLAQTEASDGTAVTAIDTVEAEGADIESPADIAHTIGDIDLNNFFGTLTFADVSSGGAQAQGGAVTGAISPDGRYVGFHSYSDNLVGGDSNGTEDVFIHDRQTGQTTRVSLASDGSQAVGGESRVADLSAGARYVAFFSNATNLVSGDTNGTWDIFVHDRQTGITTRVSVASNGDQANGSSYGAPSSISADGRYVAFSSLASNLVSGDTNGVYDTFVHDRQTGTTTRISLGPGGVQGNGDSYQGVISADGRYVTVVSYASNLISDDTNGALDVFVYDRQTGVLTRVSVASDGTQSNGDSGDVTISADGRHVAFRSHATNLVPGDTNGLLDVFAHDRLTGETTRISVAPDGTQSDGDSAELWISYDGRFVVFHSYAHNLDPESSEFNGYQQTYLHDRLTGRTTRISEAPDGTLGNHQSRWGVWLSADGQDAVFTSFASNLISPDTNGNSTDAYVYDRGAVPYSPIYYVSSTTNGSVGGVSFADEDVLAYDSTTDLWYMVFDGSDVGLGAADVDAFSLQPDGSLLLSLDVPLAVGGLGTVDDSDIVRFTPTSLGSVTAGTFTLFWDGSAYSLTDDGEDVDALAFAPDGRLLISTIGKLTVEGSTMQDEDLAALNLSTGVWSLYFDGSDVGLEYSTEDIYGAAMDDRFGRIYLTTAGIFEVTGVIGDGADVLLCVPITTGNKTACAYSLAWDGSAHGFGGEVMDALEIGDGAPPTLWLSPQTAMTVGALTVEDEDIVAYDPRLNIFYMVFDGSDAGLGTVDVDAFSRLKDGSLLLSLDAPAVIPDVGAVDDSDIIRFVPTSLGSATAGTFTMYLDGSAYGLIDDGEDIDALALASDGQLLVSTVGNLTVNGLTAQDEDLSALNLSTGVWSLYFDGSDVGLMELTTEDVNGAWVNATASQVYLTTVGAFDVPGVTGDGSDILLCQAGSLGNATSCTYSLYWDGSAHGVTSALDGLELIIP